jgi:hypothetical protein
MKNLEMKLNLTKKYIGSKQSDYEYKHRKCIKQIDAIDDELAKLYSFNKKEIFYIKNFAKKYRIGAKND